MITKYFKNSIDFIVEKPVKKYQVFESFKMLFIVKMD